MAVAPGFLSFVLEQLERIPHVSSRSMFGGVGIYSEDLFFALIGEGRLYFKVDDSNRPDFEAAGMEPFRPYGDERAMKYFEVPIDVLENRDELTSWAVKAIAVARGARKKRR